MSRSLTASMLAAILAGTVKPAIFYEGVYSSGTLRLWSGVGPIDWNGSTWTGAGNLISLSPISEVSDVNAIGFVVSLAGDADAIAALNLTAARQGLAGTVWLGAFDSAGAIIADPTKAFAGRLDKTDIDDRGDMSTISVSYESRLIDLDKTRERRYTDEDQQIDYPGDLGFEFVNSLQDNKLIWGKGTGVPSGVPVAPTGGGDVSSTESGGGGYEAGYSYEAPNAAGVSAEDFGSMEWGGDFDDGGWGSVSGDFGDYGSYGGDYGGGDNGDGAGGDW